LQAERFNVSRAAVYRVLQRTAAIGATALAADTRPLPDVAKYDQPLLSRAQHAR
jgi:hypothetical protein